MSVFDLKLTISGLYLVIVDGDREAERADRVRIFLPDIQHHQRRLTFALEDLEQPFDERIEHFISADGTRYGTVLLGESVKLTPSSGPPGVSLLRQAVDDALPLDYALEAKRVGLPLDLDLVEKAQGTHLELSEGTLYTADLFRDPISNAVQLFRIGPQEEGVAAESIGLIADDLVLYTTGYKVLVIDTGHQDLKIQLNSKFRSAVQLCVSNDLASLHRCSPEPQGIANFDNDNPFVHLGFLAPFGRKGASITLPKLADQLSTAGNPRCNGLIAFADGGRS